jgi:hypothetical protein
MRAAIFLVLASIAPLAAGCKWIDERKTNPQGRRSTDKIPEVSADQLVNFLNDRADRLKSIEYADTRMRVSGKNLKVAATLEGSLAVAQPRYFRMVSSHRIADAKVDMGSNSQEFWVYVASPGEDQPLYVFASHADFETGKARMPGGIPFEPDWVMQALGMIVYPSTNVYSVKINERERTYTLSWTAASAGGGSILKEVVFDADAATGTRPQVKKHVIRDAKTKAVLATAEIKAAQKERIGVVKGLDLPAAVEYPTHLILKWEDPRFEMDLNLDKGTMNVPLADDPGRRGLFARPEIKGARAIDLARFDK